MAGPQDAGFLKEIALDYAFAVWAVEELVEMSSVVIRPSVDADLRAITEIYAWNDLERSGHVRRFRRTSRMTRRRNFLDRGLPYLVAELDGEVVGYCYAGPFRLRAAYRHGREPQRLSAAPRRSAEASVGRCRALIVPLRQQFSECAP